MDEFIKSELLQPTPPQIATDEEFAAGTSTTLVPSVKQVSTLGSALKVGTVFTTPFGIDESKNFGRYLNGQVIIQEQFPAFTAEVKSWVSTRPSLFTTETEWQQIKSSSKLGQCGKFVIDDIAGTIRLPCVVNIQSSTDLAQFGVVKSESLPNITGTVSVGSQTGIISTVSDQSEGAFYANEDRSYCPSPNQQAAGKTLGFDASRSSLTYQNNAPVQQEAVQYPYAIVVNASVEEAECPINNYQVNNVYSYGMNQYYKGDITNNSWLKSVGQWNDGTVYTGMYNWLLEQRNAQLKTMYGWHRTTDTQIAFLTLTNTLSVGTVFYGYVPTIKAGTITAILGNDITTVNIIDNSTDTTSINVSDPVSIESQYIYDTSKMNIITKSELDNWRGSINTSGYDYVINTADQTFRLPLLNGEEDLPSSKLIGIKLSGTTSKYTAPANGFYAIAGLNLGWVDIINETAAGLGICAQPRTNDGYGRYSVYAKAGDQVVIYCGSVPESGYGASFIYAQGNGNLYYYVGDTLQNAQLINVARIEEKLTDVNAASRGYVVDSYHNGTDWYRIHSDGWIEQGGVVTVNNSTSTTGSCSNPRLFNFLKPFSNTDYTLITAIGNTPSTSSILIRDIGHSEIYTYGFVSCVDNNILARYFYACGY